MNDGSKVTRGVLVKTPWGMVVMIPLDAASDGHLSGLAGVSVLPRWPEMLSNPACVEVAVNVLKTLEAPWEAKNHNRNK